MPGENQIDGSRVDVTFADHPLNSNPDSQWQTFFKDNEVLLQIDKDVSSLSVDLKILCCKIALSVRKAPEDYAPMPEGMEAHWEVVERILFLYAKLNPGQGYVQGMNEIIGPIYYTFACDPDLDWREVRWLTLLLSQEFPLPDVLRIWDSLFADGNRFEFLIHICCSMIILLRDQLIVGDFPNNVKLLQNFPSMDIQVVLTKAAELAGLA
ncbi:hypothetical protein C0J52_18385 [Blattella germanica]|nr:hypothetical protein C0J52_18385 [Blattella germanica]